MPYTLYFSVDYRSKHSAGKSITVDEIDDFAGRNWWLDQHGYAVNRLGGKQFSLHRLITSAKPGEIVDHINGDVSDNRRENLRICTRLENTWNRRANRNKRSGLPLGVHTQKNGRFFAYIQHLGKQKRIGTYATVSEAAAAFAAESLRLRGAFSPLHLRTA